MGLIDAGLGALGIGTGGTAGGLGLSGATSAGGIAIPAFDASVGALAPSAATAGGGGALAGVLAGALPIAGGALALKALGVFDDKPQSGTQGIRNSAAYQRYTESGGGRRDAVINNYTTIYGPVGTQDITKQINRQTQRDLI